jgi:hypothetical protein
LADAFLAGFAALLLFFAFAIKASFSPPNTRP